MCPGRGLRESTPSAATAANLLDRRRRTRSAHRIPVVRPLSIHLTEITMRRITFGSSPLLVIVLAAGVAFAAPPQVATLVVENMTCGTCPIVVKKALERVPGVSAATVVFDPDKATTARLTRATTDAGFPSNIIAKPARWPVHPSRYSAAAVTSSTERNPDVISSED